MRSSDKDSSTRLASLVRGSAVNLARRLRAQTAAGDLTPARLSALRWLHRQGPMTAGQIAAADSLQPQSVTRLLASLEQDGLIVRDVDEQDRRRAVFRITREGIKSLQATVSIRDRWLAKRIDRSLNGEEKALLEKACALLDRLMEDGKP